MFHFDGTGWLRGGDVLSVQVAVYHFDAGSIVACLDDDNGNRIIQLLGQILAALTGQQF